MSDGLHFPKDFLWGAATASYQVEGAAQEDGRGESIWDRFCRTPGKVYNNHNGDVACDQYHRFEEDIALMRAIDIRAYRFSIAWPRIQPQGSGAPNQRGIDYYKRLCDALHAQNITPVATLYHWDLPAVLQDKGGWPQRDIIHRFQEYSEICFRALADRIPMWITLNEPFCTAVLGYELGVHAPGHTDRAEMIAAIHHLNMAHGRAVATYRSYGKGQIGITLNTGVIRPATGRKEDAEYADRLNDHSRMYLWPLFGQGYPERYVRQMQELGAPLPIRDGDLKEITQKIDFLGFNYYFEWVASAPQDAPSPSPPQMDFPHFAPNWQRESEMGWASAPQGLYRHLQWIKNEVGDMPIYITENGYAGDDNVSPNKRIRDYKRIEFLHAHLREVARAIRDGITIKGYFVWSLLDNFEWGWGYTKRFGIIYCDYTTLERIPKNSYYFYRDCIAGYVEY